ncbi:DNA primase [Arsenicicoccus dermatophilus]|uniref:DNA primase n=1 Tax=Arsenicicoccus dermatophilus TaxID=1076331 RepID=UPI001F4CF9F8|nr:DNA primase [Arsenicicoccus dermatophilus]
MALIKAEDIALVKERASIEDVVREHVSLRSAGPGSLKGLCPFHDEKTPSFTVRPGVGAYHCFGCGVGGDVIRFVQEVDHLTFVEAVERLAGQVGVQLRHEDGEAPQREPAGRRQRLVEANRVAAELYAEALLSLPEARPARDFLRAKGFGGKDCGIFGVGYAPRAGEAVTGHLRSKGFTDEEIVTSGLAVEGRRGPYDRFRGRVVWPIRDVTGDTVGFGARRIFDDDRIEAKYLNTSETPIYKKTQVLYGLDLAKRAMARDRQAVVVEGYTDVMACHLAGIQTAVATCGTSFGVDHIKTLRRILRDEAGRSPAKVIFTFDGDAAGQKAAMRAFGEDQRWASQSFVAVAEAGQDPNELRQSGGDEAVRHLVEDAVPMFEFAVRTTIARFDLGTAEGRVMATRTAAPIIASIRDQGLRPEYIRTVAGWIGLPVEQVAHEVSIAGTAAAQVPAEPVHREPAEPTGPSGTAVPPPDLRDPVVAAEQQLLQCLLQHPGLFDAAAVDALEPEAMVAPAYQLVVAGLQAAGGLATAAGRSGQAWTSAVAEHVDEEVRPLVIELAVAPIPSRLDPQTGAPSRRYADELILRVREVSLRRRIADAISALQRMDPTQAEEARSLGIRLQGLQRELAALRSELS